MPLRRFIYPLAAVLATVFFGTVGYRALEGWSWFDGLYMTVITLATIGYGEVRPLTPAGRAFTIILIVVGVTVFGFLISILTQAVVETEIASVLGRRRLFKDISQLKDHYILCGAGRVGARVVDELKIKGVDYVVIERDEAVLEGARVRAAKALITAASTDAENVYIVLTARGLNPDIYIVTRANDQAAERQLLRAGANKVVSPVLIGSHRMAQAALTPAVADFLELTTMTESLDLYFEQVRVVGGSLLDGKQIKDSRIRSEHNAMIVAITPPEGEMIFNPNGEQTLRAGDLLIAIGTRAGLLKLAEIASGR